MINRQDILLAGAGIAGCAAAITLAARGHRVRLIERQAAWAFASSGIFLYSNALESLADIGVLDRILDAGFVIPDGRNVYYDHTGQELARTHYPTARGGAVPAIVGIRRSELHRVLAERLAEVGVRTELDTRITGLVDDGSAVQVNLTGNERARFDLVVGCEGLRSPLREYVTPGNEPNYSGFGIWRSVHRRPADLVDKIMMMGVGSRLGIMPISNDQLYMFGTVHDPSKTWHDPHAWPGLMAATFAEYQGPARQFLDEVEERECEVLYTAVEEVELTPPWHQGRVLLIGDAAHASTPFMGQGGAMALEDAVTLGHVLDEVSADVALETFTARRYPVCNFAQTESRKVGESGALEDAESCQRRNANFGRTAQSSVDHFYAELRRLQGTR